MEDGMEMPEQIADESRCGRIARNLRRITDAIIYSDDAAPAVRDIFRKMISYTWTDEVFSGLEKALAGAIRDWRDEIEEESENG